MGLRSGYSVTFDLQIVLEGLPDIALLRVMCSIRSPDCATAATGKRYPGLPLVPEAVMIAVAVIATTYRSQ
jgi:hypothetical protein